jgi:hypothetical protein
MNIEFIDKIVMERGLNMRVFLRFLKIVRYAKYTSDGLIDMTGSRKKLKRILNLENKSYFMYPIVFWELSKSGFLIRVRRAFYKTNDEWFTFIQDIRSCGDCDNRLKHYKTPGDYAERSFRKLLMGCRSVKEAAYRMNLSKSCVSSRMRKYGIENPFKRKPPVSDCSSSDGTVVDRKDTVGQISE